MAEKIILNPITDTITDSIKHSKDRISLAVPFISSFAKKVLSEESLRQLTDKRLITRFEDTNINTFDLPTLDYLLDHGFQICYNNSIHLKLYVTDYDAFITSSNLTDGGFEKNIELTVKADRFNFNQCIDIFENLWNDSKSDRVTKALISENMQKYEVLKKRQKFEKRKMIELIEKSIQGPLDIQQLLEVIFNANEDYTGRLHLAFSANRSRNILKNELIKNGFDTTLFYAPSGDQNRKNLLYDFAYGIESKLAGTGLRDSQFRQVFEHPDFKNVISYIFPESVGLEPWHLDDNRMFFNFCQGLFDFDIPQYTSVIPIRLASYFYPEHFVPIFNLKHLQKACEILGIQPDARTNGERLFAYNSFLKNRMKDIPYDNYIKSGMIYQVSYTVELQNRLENGESFQEVLKSYKKGWVKGFIKKGKQLLDEINNQ